MEKMNIDVKGFSVERLLTLDPNTLTKQALSQVVTRLDSAVNKRIKNFTNKNIDISKMGGYTTLKPFLQDEKLSVKNKGIKALQGQFRAIQTVYGLKTSTVKGYKAVERMESKIGIDKGDFYEILHKLQEIDPEFNSKMYAYTSYDSSNQYSVLYREMLDMSNKDGMTKEELEIAMTNRLTSLMQKNNQLNQRLSNDFKTI